MKFKLSIYLLIFILFSNCASQRYNAESVELNKLVDQLTGSYNSHAQAELDTNFYNISLHMYPVAKDNKAHYIYVEQALSSRPNKPYRQRIYKIEQLSSTKFQSSIYTLEQPEELTGTWKNQDSLLQAFQTAVLSEKKGCAVILELKKEGYYTGATKKKKCKSTHMGSSYASSLVTLEKNILSSWDQGWNEDDEQVWGSTAGAYEFVKIHIR